MQSVCLEAAQMILSMMAMSILPPLTRTTASPTRFHENSWLA
jgi:hypothetical protein